MRALLPQRLVGTEPIRSLFISFPCLGLRICRLQHECKAQENFSVGIFHDTRQLQRRAAVSSLEHARYRLTSR